MKQIKKRLIWMVGMSFLAASIMPALAEEPVHPGYPYVFDMTGKIERMSEGVVVIEDDLFKVSSDTTYHSPDTIFTKSSEFQEKDFVGLVLKDKKTREILSIWLIKKGP
jgi:hypothetical protein